MEWVKTTAKTLPEAIDLALDNLGVDESEAEIVVLEEPKQGLFGRMRGTARVEARVKPKPIRPKNDRNRNRRKSSDDSRGGDRNRNRNRNRKGGDRSGGNGRDGGRSDEQRSKQAKQGNRDGGTREGGRSSAGNSRRRGGSGEQGRGRGEQRNDRTKQKSSNGAGRTANDDRGRQRSDGGGEAKASGEVSQGAPVEDVSAHLQTFLTDLTEAFGLEGDVRIDDSEEGTLVGQIEGRHGLLVGPKGRTLDAVQELARISCQRSTPSSIRIKVDVGGYRAQRAAALGDFAAKAADRAVAEGAEVALEPMSPADRKSVHDALNGDERVETRSVGSEPRRRVVVVPLESVDEDAEEDDGLIEVEDSIGSAAGEEE